MNLLSIVAFTAGAALAVQAALNSQLGNLLKNPILATVVAFCSSVFFTALALVISTKEYPSIEVVKSVPIYFWFSGGLFSAFGISMFYYLIPKMGISPMLSYALAGQMIVGIVAGHFGWFNLPLTPLSLVKVGGVLALITGILIINNS